MRVGRYLFSNMLVLGVIVGLVISAGMNADAGATLTAKEIMENAALSRKLDGSEAVMKLIIQNGKGEKRERKIAMVTKLFDNGKTEKRVYRFLSPADVKGTGVLAFDYENKGDDMWIYLPALRKTRRIVTSERSKAFMGSEFSYADMNTPTLTDYTFRTLKEEAVDGVSCWLIEVKPKNEDVAEDEGYSKKKIWIAKEEYTIRKALYFDLEGELLKELKSKNIECLDELKKRYRSKYMEMTNKQNGRKSIFKIEKIENIPNTKDLYFTTEYLERP